MELIPELYLNLSVSDSFTSMITDFSCFRICPSVGTPLFTDSDLLVVPSQRMRIEGERDEFQGPCGFDGDSR